MTANEHNKDQNGPAEGKSSPADSKWTRGVSSQAGLSSFAGGRAKSLPSVPAQGHPGSRFNPRVVSREEQAARRTASKATPGVRTKSAGKKSLGLGAPSGLIQGVPLEIMNPGSAVEPEQSVAGAAAQGFVGGALAGVQANTGVKQVEHPEADAKTAKAPEAPAATSKVVMNPKHVASLEALDSQQADGLEDEGVRFGRLMS